jgi:hypothetical protein
LPEDIPDPDMVSRLLFEPSMRAEDKDLIWANLFQFPSDQGQCESVVWRKYAVDIQDVHVMGCAKQTSDRSKGRHRSTYFGAITGNVGDIRSIRSPSGASLTIVQVPDEGAAHAHVGFSPGCNKNDRNSLKFLLKSKFGPLEAHTCA